MAMNNKEKKEVEELRTLLALHITEAEGPDVPIPVGNEVTHGWAVDFGMVTVVKRESRAQSNGPPGYDARSAVMPRCGIRLFSTPERAWRWLRTRRELEFAGALRRIDQKIEASRDGQKD